MAEAPPYHDLTRAADDKGGKNGLVQAHTWLWQNGHTETLTQTHGAYGLATNHVSPWQACVFYDPDGSRIHGGAWIWPGYKGLGWRLRK